MIYNFQNTALGKFLKCCVSFQDSPSNIVGIRQVQLEKSTKSMPAKNSEVHLT
jgi:hypothetical protein